MAVHSIQILLLARNQGINTSRRSHTLTHGASAKQGRRLEHRKSSCVPTPTGSKQRSKNTQMPRLLAHACVSDSQHLSKALLPAAAGIRFHPLINPTHARIRNPNQPRLHVPSPKKKKPRLHVRGSNSKRRPETNHSNSRNRPEPLNPRSITHRRTHSPRPRQRESTNPPRRSNAACLPPSLSLKNPSPQFAHKFLLGGKRTTNQPPPVVIREGGGTAPDQRASVRRGRG